MKKIFNLKYIVLALAAIGFSSCEDDDPISAGIGDPGNKNVVNIEATVTPDQMITGEGNTLGFQVTLPNSFSTDVTVTARIELDNGTSNIGTAEIPAGSTTGSGTVPVPADDDVLTGDTIGGVPNAATLKLTAILLDDLEPNTTYTISSNTADLGIYADTLDADAGLNILFDWENPGTYDLDLYVFDSSFNLLERSETGSRFESDLFQNIGRADGEYLIYTAVFGPALPEDIGFDLLMTLPDGGLEVVSGTLAAGFTDGFLASFEKSTDADSGEVSYINFTPLF